MMRGAKVGWLIGKRKRICNESPDSTFVDSFKEAVSEDDEWNVVTLIFNAAAYANMFKLLERYGYDPSEMSRL